MDSLYIVLDWGSCRASTSRIRSHDRYDDHPRLSTAGRHQESLKACINALQGNPEEAFAYKYAWKSLLALGQLEKAQQCLTKAHKLEGSDPEIAKDIGNIFLNLGNKDNALHWY
ncbi:hypothetical protein [Prochlorococcus sp. MIT 1303]|uniref:hypothetical protein n=1 Tax=Prochlorococcus sp. MIT 1303 TaxID=1723647 RepID=UPI0007B3F83B|nr:hypothetical protein [Prochlorococcus sp. MIT 1303]KZR69987.1 Tetratricopeptide repeat [Prochlorococcus sp. MIT 1303]